MVSGVATPIFMVFSSLDLGRRMVAVVGVVVVVVKAGFGFVSVEVVSLSQKKSFMPFLPTSYPCTSQNLALGVWIWMGAIICSEAA
mmetsp:Transcript_12534/g.27206  ORF Transcript_12534/g.27206 Transcript_12534/m.27206 type:complete len:86 (-) Transcript_12534:3768-4025(-)